MPKHCCPDMAARATFVCAHHPDGGCADELIRFVPKFDEYGIVVHDGGSSFVAISFCPWCGSELPPSQRDRWFDEIEALGIDPWGDSIPDEYTDGRWLQRPSGGNGG